MVVVGLALALVERQQRYNRLANEALNLEIAYEGLCEFAVLNEKWEITTKEGYMEVRRPSMSMPSLQCDSSGITRLRPRDN
jgi:hypothetical protein